ncbi:DEAD/DEAH box helicase [Nitrosospira sp. NRS527]|uniref:helicase-related protein n=1 Tax=Nitrosospira sp. NRS527 TaxID=155925 RepID=UPI001AF3E7DE|nr:DEAD/DEAH box helicase [Nitrosospira sp. NRS527]BCT68870.1 RNA polymerase-associated protein RapA [Nitrosospira sp. NRS527]
MKETTTSMLVNYNGIVRSVLRTVSDFGFESYDLVGPPRRLNGHALGAGLVETNVDKRRVNPVRATVHPPSTKADGDSLLSMTARSLARLYAGFLAAEDPQRRLDAHKAATLMHQVSLVQHILTQPNLRRVMIGDEVGLGKTIEAGLLIRRLLDQEPSIRVLYLAPARLVSNVTNELRDKLDLDARQWVAGSAGDARLDSDRLVVASINKAVFGDNLGMVAKSGPWDVLIVDECHHLSDWGPSGGKPNQAFKLVSQLVKAQRPEGRLILMSGTPHQGSESRFKNLMRLLADDSKSLAGAKGRVIFRTKDRVRDWRNQPLFPAREIRLPTVVQLGATYERWYAGISALYDTPSETGFRSRAAGWAKGQALQWAASSVQAGLGFLVRLSMRRLGWTLARKELASAIGVLRPYRGGAINESLDALYARLEKQIGRQGDVDDTLSDSEEFEEEVWSPDPMLLGALLNGGVGLLGSEAGHAKWEALCRIVDAADGEKIVLFAQPVETVAVVAAFLERRYGEKPALIIGNQSDEDRLEQVRAFQSNQGPRFLVSSRAGGEGLNMQRARRLVHLDVPWNPMELEQRVGRVHRFGSRKTIVVDTVVAAGSREVDMYRIAREKLAVIASQLAPDQFELLFSRVMSLVPPKELEDIIGGARLGLLGTFESNEIGRLVTEGFRSWNDFDNAYRHEADRIRALDQGQATWADLGNFLVKFGGADPSDDVSLSVFEFRNDEIESVHETLPAITLNGKSFVCGDTGGLPVETKNGDRAYALGLNLEEIVAALRIVFIFDRDAGFVVVRNSKELDQIVPDVEFLIALLRQSVRFEGGAASESGLSIHVFSVDRKGATSELRPEIRAEVIRGLLRAQRVRDWPADVAYTRLDQIERELASELRVPNEREVASGIRHCIWPLATVILVK